MKTTNARDAFLARKIASFCRSFLENIRKYHRDPVTGGYTWAYQGPSLLIPIDPRDWTLCKEYGLFDGPEEGYPLVINEKLIGDITTWNPAGYPRTFVVLHFAPEMQYRPAVILQFARYAGMIVRDYDSSLLIVEKDPYNCKTCGKPIAQSIEGKIICSRCWTQEQDNIHKTGNYWDTHCNEEGCEAELHTRRELNSRFCYRHRFNPHGQATSTEEGKVTLEHYLTHCKVCDAEIAEATVYCKKHALKPTYKFR